MLGIGPVLDVVLGKSALLQRPSRDSGRPFEVILFAHAILQLLAVCTLVLLAHGEASLWIVLFAAVSTGINSGASGLIVAHELGHRRKKSFPWWIAQLNLVSVLYLHFTTDTIKRTTSMWLPRLIQRQLVTESQSGGLLPGRYRGSFLTPGDFMLCVVTPQSPTQLPAALYLRCCLWSALPCSLARYQLSRF